MLPASMRSGERAFGSWRRMWLWLTATAATAADFILAHDALLSSGDDLYYSLWKL